MPSTATVTTSSRAAVYVGRQPIFDRDLKVYAYELLYRSGMSGGAAQGRVSGDRATTDTIVNAFLEIGLERLVGTRCGAINLTEDFLLGEKARSDEGIIVDQLNLTETEKTVIRRALSKNNGNISHAAKELGLTRTSLYRRMEKYGL